jgi:hypothetical protein
LMNNARLKYRILKRQILFVYKLIMGYLFLNLLALLEHFEFNFRNLQIQKCKFCELFDRFLKYYPIFMLFILKQLIFEIIRQI